MTYTLQISHPNHPISMLSSWDQSADNEDYLLALSFVQMAMKNDLSKWYILYWEKIGIPFSKHSDFSLKRCCKPCEKHKDNTSVTFCPSGVWTLVVVNEIRNVMK